MLKYRDCTQNPSAESDNLPRCMRIFSPISLGQAHNGLFSLRFSAKDRCSLAGHSLCQFPIWLKPCPHSGQIISSKLTRLISLNIRKVFLSNIPDVRDVGVRAQGHFGPVGKGGQRRLPGRALRGLLYLDTISLSGDK